MKCLRKRRPPIVVWRFVAGPDRVRCVAHKLSFERFPAVLQSSPLSIIPSMLHFRVSSSTCCFYRKGKRAQEWCPSKISIFFGNPVTQNQNIFTFSLHEVLSFISGLCTLPHDRFLVRSVDNLKWPMECLERSKENM